MDTQILEDIGLTNGEIKVYLALLELGTSSAGPVIEKSGLQSSVVFTSIGKLTQKGLVSSIKEGKKNYYQASDPKHIVEYIDEKKNRVEAMLPQLISRQALSKEKPEAKLFRGIRGMKEILFELLDAGGKEHHTLGAPIESAMMGSAWWSNYHKKRSVMKITARIVFNDSMREWAKNIVYPEKYTEIRFTKKGFEPLMETIIRNDKVGILLWTENPIGILIHNKALAESYDKFFEVAWKTAYH